MSRFHDHPVFEAKAEVQQPDREETKDYHRFYQLHPRGQVLVSAVTLSHHERQLLGEPFWGKVWPARVRIVPVNSRGKDGPVEVEMPPEAMDKLAVEWIRHRIEHGAIDGFHKESDTGADWMLEAASKEQDDGDL